MSYFINKTKLYQGQIYSRSLIFLLTIVVFVNLFEMVTPKINFGVINLPIEHTFGNILCDLVRLHYPKIVGSLLYWDNLPQDWATLTYRF